MSGHEDKGKRYIAQLDAARVKAAWTELPELIRKVAKHASSQKTLIDTATADHYVATSTTQRPQTAQRTNPDTIQKLKDRVESSENTLAEDTFQGKSCLVWAQWVGVAPGMPDTINTSDIVPTFDRYGQKGTSLWTKICLVRNAYIQANNHVQRGEEAQAVAVYRAAAAWIELNSDLVTSAPQLSYWSETILSELGTCQLSAASKTERRNALHLWSILTAKSPTAAGASFGNNKTQPSHTNILHAYYTTLSENLAHADPTDPANPQLATELRKAEAAYETVLLRNLKFPKATESNIAVEAWVEQVISNWRILCHPSWREADLGEGGRNALTRNVLDVLYRAATKTFHSTLILRRLFQVHKALTEFELAFGCLDTYIQLADRARSRALKASEVAPESDEMMLLAVSEGVEALCCYGQLKEAQRAFDLSAKLEDWLQQIFPSPKETQPNGFPEFRDGSNGVDEDRLPSPAALQKTHRAIGIAKATWAKWTPFTENRDELQAEAMVSLRTAVTFAKPSSSTLYALALLCAETRDIPQALKWTKSALQQLSETEPAAGASKVQCAFWHLLTLLLSSQQDFAIALQTSAATLDSIVTSGLGLAANPNGSVGKQTLTNGRTASDLECYDLQGMIELQISYLALIELTEGPEAALNHTSEALSLYSSLFKKYELGDIRATPAQESLVPPKSSAGTMKSTKGSIFSRRKHTPSAVPSTIAPGLPSIADTETEARPSTRASEAPAIQVTDESGQSPASKKHHHHLTHRNRDQSGSKRLSKASRPNTAKAIKDDMRIDHDRDVITAPTSHASNDIDAVPTISPTNTNHDSHEAKQGLGEIPHNVSSHEKAPPPVGHDMQPPEQDVRLPTVHADTSSTSPIPRFPKALAQKHALVVLCKLWITVAALYRRAHIFDDAKEALEEASKTASRIESIVSASDPSAKILAEVGWGGGGKSSDMVWADVHCARAELLQAIAHQRTEEGTPATVDTLREIVEQYEHCLMYFPDHPNGIVGLSDILLDYYERKIDLAKKVDDGRSLGIKATKQLREEDVVGPATPSPDHIHDPFLQSASGEDLRKTPENLNRIAARDRAYGLLDGLTKLGSGWDDSEAWYALARAHELGGEVEKSKKILWWCIELEDSRPIRHWRNLGSGGYVL